ncbi:peroxisome proliferator-activated receptor gamma coactivator-related protein 1 isoform X1 [Poecilia reticulata]|uniref:peroxisome proliferator-activated receptor gamma coactivator-related protein 1 isoform X1 n=1 Tax=Poecilia reticulata TaxID=8081 RepID=UPI0004A4E4A8|nr:PREDICTED: peroxisome proliferator-activated receptor gamma coactivator-related protein 1 isoform X1 [Poecilia reticulata]
MERRWWWRLRGIWQCANWMMRRKGRRKGRKRRRWMCVLVRWRGGQGEAFSCTGMNMTQRQQPDPLLLSSHLPVPSEKDDREVGGEACNHDDGRAPPAGLSSEESLQSCIDPSILSIFDDVPTLEAKGFDEESEATLLTALTEILDNVDDENLSPFDTLPDSDMLSKGREHSPLRRMLCLSRSPQKDSLGSTRPLSGGKNLSRMQGGCVQRSDGEEEEDGSFTQSPDRLESSPDPPGWEGLPLPLPILLEQEGQEGLSVSLADLVRHMHPYCMAISVENEEGEQMLPEGGIVLEVVDQSENGEPIFTIPNMDLSYSLHQPLTENEVKPEAAEDELADSSEHIVVDDEDDVPVRKTFEIAPADTPVVCLDVSNKVKRKKERKTTSPARRKKKCNEKQQSELVEGRVLRSGTVRRVITDPPKKPQKGSGKEKVQKSQKVMSASSPPEPLLKPEGIKQIKTEKENTTAAQAPETNEKLVSPLLPEWSATLTPEESRLTCSAVAVSSHQPSKTPKQSATAPEEKESSSSASSVSLPLISSETPAAAAVPEISPPVSITPAVPEAKPKPLSLEEYRRLRQQKKPAPVEKPDKSVTRWPSLPELPKELPPLPHLPDPNPKDPRRANPLAARKELEEAKPAWRPKGPCAPPTPEALLQPPAYMISSSTKASPAVPVSKPQQTQEPSKLLQNLQTVPPDSAKTPAAHPDAAAKPTEPHVPQSFAPPASLKPLVQVVSSADGRCSPSASGRKCETESINPKSVQDTKVCPETTTDVHKPTDASQDVPGIAVSTLSGGKLASDRKSSKPATKEQSVQPRAAVSVNPHHHKNHSALVESKQGSTTAMNPQRTKSNTQELIESFTSEIGIEAADLTSLLEQFEETQAKEEKCVPEVSGRAAAVGNSRAASIPEKAVQCERINDLSNSAALAPKTTSPNQMWKPLAPVALLGKPNNPEAPKSTPYKVIQIEAKPLPPVRVRSKATPAAAPVAPDVACMDHDYCLSNKSVSLGESGKRWNIKQQSVFTIKPLRQHASSPPPTLPPVLAASPQEATNSVISSRTQDCPQTVQAQKNGDASEQCSVPETSDFSPSQQERVTSPRKGPSGRSYRRYVASQTPSPSCSPKERTRGRSRKRFYRSPSPTSSCSDAYTSRSRSRSKSPAKKRYRHRNSDSSLSSSSRSSSRSSPSLSRSPPRRRRYSYSSSRSGSWSRSTSRSPSPQRQAQWSRSRGLHSPSYRSRYCTGTKTNVEETKRRKEKAIEERRVVYVGKIRGSMTQRELRERFSLFGEIEECTLHFREHGDNYGFITYYNTKDAFTAIENGSKLRKPDELPFDLCFGGRRQFCQSNYADLDSSREYDPFPTKGKYHALDFDTLLKQAQQNLKR